MNALHNSLFTIFQSGITYLVCGVVWVTLTAGLYQLVRDRFYHTRRLQKRTHRLLRSQQADQRL